MANMTKDRINVRANTLTYKKINKRNRHDYRKYTEAEFRDNIKKYGIPKKLNVVYKSEDAEANIMNKHSEIFEKYYKKQVGRKPQKENVSPFVEMVLTFPHKYQDNENYTYQQWNTCLAKYSKLLTEKTGMKIINIIEHNDETTRHYHIKTTNYKIDNNNIMVNGLLTQKDMQESLQDIAGEAFKDLGLRRGNKKIKPTDKNKTVRRWVEEETQKMADALEDDIITFDEIEELIKTSDNPFKKFYRNFKRLMGYEEELTKTQEAINKLTDNILKEFPILKKHIQEDMSNLEIVNLLISKISKSTTVKETIRENLRTTKK